MLSQPDFESLPNCERCHLELISRQSPRNRLFGWPQQSPFWISYGCTERSIHPDVHVFLAAAFMAHVNRVSIFTQDFGHFSWHWTYFQVMVHQHSQFTFTFCILGIFSLTDRISVSEQFQSTSGGECEVLTVANELLR